MFAQIFLTVCMLTTLNVVNMQIKFLFKKYCAICFPQLASGKFLVKFPAMDRFFYNTAMSWERRSACAAGISTKEISLDRTVYVSHSLPPPQAFARPSEHGIIN